MPVSKSHFHNSAVVLQVWSLDPQKHLHLETDKESKCFIYTSDLLNNRGAAQCFHFTECPLCNFNSALIWALFSCKHYEFQNLFICEMGKSMFHAQWKMVTASDFPTSILTCSPCAKNPNCNNLTTDVYGFTWGTVSWWRQRPFGPVSSEMQNPVRVLH